MTRRVHWGAKTPSKKRATPKRRTQEIAARAAARQARDDNPNIAALYDAFSGGSI